jgi:KDO2-lipid IV(A) lauroyltransferase
MADSTSSSSLLSPKHWLTWISMGCWFLIAQLPYSWQMKLGRLSAPLLGLNKKRIAIIEKNVELCFPSLTSKEKKSLIAANIESTAVAAFETGIAFFWSKKRLAKLFTISGLEHVEAVSKRGEGAMLLSLHMTTLDIGSAMLGIHVNYDGMYTPHKNPVFDYVQKVRREAYAKGGVAFSRDNVRLMIGQLRKGRMIWYAPDRDMGAKGSVFVPFFGIDAATITATAQFARMGKARVIPFTQYRLPNDKGYRVEISPPLTDFPTGDDIIDARRVNAIFEQMIAVAPEQYLWALARFKTRPEGEPRIYP